MKSRTQRLLNRLLAGVGYRLIPLTEEQKRYFQPSFDQGVLPPGAAEYLDERNPKLQELRARYAAVEAAARTHSQWNQTLLKTVNLRRFRGDNAYVWQYRHLKGDAELKYFIITQYTEALDERGLLRTLLEDGAFGCWAFRFGDRPAVSRDLLDSIHEIYFLDRYADLFSSPGITVLDVGAGYGRLAHRLLAAVPDVGAYYCVDAIPESTFLCDYFLRYRACGPQARVLALDEITTALNGQKIDIAVNIHSFSECTYQAIEWWLRLLADLNIRRLMIVPNDGIPFLSTEQDGTRRNFEPLLSSCGFRTIAREPKFRDSAIQMLLRTGQHMYMFERS
jgi:SAM-dependent methyltransferase